MSTSNVIPLGNVTKLDLPVDMVLDAAKETLSSVVIMGWHNDGYLYFASTSSDGGDILWMLEKCKQSLLEIGE